MPVHNWKFAPIVRDATERVRRGVIGQIERVKIEVERLRDFTGADPSRPNWRRDRSIAGGGILMDHGWHAVYLALQWFGSLPRGVNASFERPAPGAVEDEAEVRLEFERGEAAIVLTWNGKRRRNAMRLDGEKGSIAIADDRLIVRTSDGEEEVTYSAALSADSHHADWFAAFIPQLASYFESPQTSRTAFEEAAACLEVVHKAYEAERR